MISSLLILVLLLAGVGNCHGEFPSCCPGVQEAGVLVQRGSPARQLNDCCWGVGEHKKRGTVTVEAQLSPGHRLLLELTGDSAQGGTKGPK